jgi:uncharacterized membrane protein
MASASHSFDTVEAAPLPRPGARPAPLKEWRLTRGCSITPRSFMLHLSAMALTLLGAAAVLAAMGSPLCAGACVLLVGTLLAGGLYFAIHMADGEHVLLYADRLIVRRHRGLGTRSYSFNPRFAHFECGRGNHEGYYWLRYGEIRLPLGHRLPPVPRCMAVAEITTALLRFHP